MFLVIFIYAVIASFFVVPIIGIIAAIHDACMMSELKKYDRPKNIQEWRDKYGY